MIVKSSFRRIDGLEAHLRRTDKNEEVNLRLDLFRGAEDLDVALRLMEALARTNPRVQRDLVHVIVSPDHDLTEAELVQALDLAEAEYGISPDALRAVVTHLKGARATHVHIVYSIVDPATGKAVKSNKNFETDELISRRLEVKFGERIIPGPRLEANIAELRRRGLDHEAERLAVHAPVRHKDGLSRKDKRQADRLNFDARAWSRDAFALFERAGRDLGAFARLLDDKGLLLARDDERGTMLIDDAGSRVPFEGATLLVDDATGFSSSLVRLLRREAKAAGRPLDVKEKQLKYAFPKLLPFKDARDLGLERARSKAGRDLEIEVGRATTEAIIDADAGALEAFRIRKRRQAEDEQARLKAEAAATLNARREAIQALYRERDEIRRRRVDRAVSRARLFETPGMRRAVFGLAAAGVVLSGGSLGLAIAGGAVAVSLLPTRARARMLAASAKRERAEDAARRRVDTDGAYRQARATQSRSASVRFTFEQIDKQDRVLAGLYAEALLRRDPLSADAMAAGRALGDQVVAGLVRMLERGSRLQVRRLQHWYRGIAPERRDRAVKAALDRHAAVRGRTAQGKHGQPQTRPNRRGNTRGRSRSDRNGPEI